VREGTIDTNNGGPQDGSDQQGAVELRDVLVIETNDGQRHEFEVVGLVEDEEKNGYAVCYSEKVDEFVVTDAFGALLEDAELAQEILDDFFELAEESVEEGPTEEGTQ
jgi:hypothetical protein